LIVGISKKLIFTSLLFINFIQLSKSADLEKISRSENNLETKISRLKISNIQYLPTTLDPLFRNDLDENFLNKKILKPSKILLSAVKEKQNEIVIQSDKQSEINNVIYAEGNVSVFYKGNLLEADNLTYDKLNNEISALGNVVLILRDQVFKASQLEYSFINKKGYLLDVRGSINTETLMNDLSSNFSLSDTNKIQSLLKLEKNKF